MHHFFLTIFQKKKIIQPINLSLSRKTIKVRILKLESDTTKQLKQDLSSCKYFPICIDESTDIKSSASNIFSILQR